MLRAASLGFLLTVSLALSACDIAGSVEDDTHVIENGTVGTAVHTPETVGGWTKVWSDEFDGDQIDPAKWAYDIDCWGGGNEERQCYTDSAENSVIRDGRLVISARKGEFSGPALPERMITNDAEREAINTKPFSSARMVTRGKAAWKYGWIEIRAKLPQGQGTWPAIWMLPEDNTYGPWASSGEIDILEAVNLGVHCAECPGGIENTVLGTLHFGGNWPNNKLHSTEIAQPGSLDDFHTYGVVWSEGKMTWLIDGHVFAVKTADDWSTTASDDPNAPFDKPFHLILNLAIGGKLPEERGLGGVSDEGFPKELEVDWVRVWQCEADLATGNACQIEDHK